MSESIPPGSVPQPGESEAEHRESGLSDAAEKWPSVEKTRSESFKNKTSAMKTRSLYR